MASTAQQVANEAEAHQQRQPNNESNCASSQIVFTLAIVVTATVEAISRTCCSREMFAGAYTTIFYSLVVAIVAHLQVGGATHFGWLLNWTFSRSSKRLTSFTCCNRRKIYLQVRNDDDFYTTAVLCLCVFKIGFRARKCFNSHSLWGRWLSPSSVRQRKSFLFLLFWTRQAAKEDADEKC